MMTGLSLDEPNHIADTVFERLADSDICNMSMDRVQIAYDTASHLESFVTNGDKAQYVMDMLGAYVGWDYDSDE